ISCSVNVAPLSWEMGTDDVLFTVVATKVETDDKVFLKGYVESNGNKSYDFDAIDHTIDNTLKATVPSYLTPGKYTFGVELPDDEESNDNYKLPTAASAYRKDFTVKGQGLSLTADNMPWRCKFTDKDGLEIPVDITGAGYVTGKAKLTYNGYKYEFYVDTDVLAALGAQIDTSKGKNGISGDAECTNATSTSKTFTVYWKPADGYEGNGGNFTLTYDIEKAKYDLTTAKWNYTNPQEYDPLQFRTVQIVDLPDGLKIDSTDYSNNRNKNAGPYTAKVVNIQNSNNNYYTPSITDKTTYIYNDAEFPWTLDWEIAPKKLTLNWVEKNSDNNDFVYYVVNGDEAERIESYLYYKDADYDNTTGVASGSPIALSDIQIVSKQVDAYWAVAVLKDPNNYTIESNKAKRFTVGSLKEIVRVELKDNSPFIYNGNQYGKDLIVSSDENTLTSAHIVKKYYKDSISDANLISDAPIDAGKYILVVSLQDGLEDDYELVVKDIPFEIEKAKIVATWNTEGNIPKLTNENNYQDIIGYEYFDADGNMLADGAKLEAGKSYKVKAILKGNYGDNYEFVEADGETVLEDPTTTDEQEFTVKKDNSQGGNVGTDDGKEPNLIDKLLASHFPLWQVIVMAVAGLLSLIFVIKAAQYGSRANKAKGDAKRIRSKAYAALLPIFSTDVVALGLTNQIWSIMAFAFVGLALAMLVVALIMRSRWKKAEAAKETAVEEREERRYSNGNGQASNELK
ncbi:MAG: hypothetical protein K2N18_00005, partial [Clostridia bacterium]|nr:hypothetical protein [Clostridia bacterium]